MDLVKALINIRPNSIWELNGDDYDGLVWNDETQTKPTREELETEALRIQAEYEANEYQRLRAKEYPSFADQFDTLYHDGFDAWKATIDAVKAKYPKP